MYVILKCGRTDIKQRLVECQMGREKETETKKMRKEVENELQAFEWVGLRYIVSHSEKSFVFHLFFGKIDAEF